MAVELELLEGLFRTVGRGGEAVGAEADPGEESDEGETVKDPGIRGVLRLPEDEFLCFVGDAQGGPASFGAGRWGMLAGAVASGQFPR